MYMDRSSEDIQQRLDVKIIGRKDDLEQHLLVHGDEFLIPFADISRALAVLVLVLLSSRELLATMVLAVL